MALGTLQQNIVEIVSAKWRQFFVVRSMPYFHIDDHPPESCSLYMLQNWQKWFIILSTKTVGSKHLNIPLLLVVVEHKRQNIDRNLIWTTIKVTCSFQISCVLSLFNTILVLVLEKMMYLVLNFIAWEFVCFWSKNDYDFIYRIWPNNAFFFTTMFKFVKSV